MQAETKWIMDYLDARPMLDDIVKAINLASAWSRKDHGYPSKNERIKEWNWERHLSEITPFYEILCHIFAGAILNEEGMTYQAMIGYIAGDVACADPLDRAKCAAEVIALAYQADLIVITKIDDQTFQITTEYELDEDVPEFTKHAPTYSQPEPMAYNPILGCHFKQHDKDVCLDHINLMNSIPLSLNFGVIMSVNEEPKEALETQEEVDQWNDFHRRSWDMYHEVSKNGNRFHMNHSVDTRGRTYCGGYYINYQGSSFKKAIVELADKEIVGL